MGYFHTPDVEAKHHGRAEVIVNLVAKVKLLVWIFFFPPLRTFLQRARFSFLVAEIYRCLMFGHASLSDRHLHMCLGE